MAFAIGTPVHVDGDKLQVFHINSYSNLFLKHAELKERPGELFSIERLSEIEQPAPTIKAGDKVRFKNGSGKIYTVLFTNAGMAFTTEQPDIYRPFDSFELVASAQPAQRATPAAINRIMRDDVEFFREMRDGDNSDVGNNIFDLYQQIATKSAIYPGQGTPLGLVYVALKGAGEAGEFAEHVGKAMRDDALMGIDPTNGNFWSRNISTERHAALVKEIGDELWYLAAKCNELGIKLSDAALANLEKLCDRTKQDTLRGSGDDR